MKRKLQTEHLETPTKKNKSDHQHQDLYEEDGDDEEQLLGGYEHLLQDAVLDTVGQNFAANESPDLLAHRGDNPQFSESEDHTSDEMNPAILGGGGRGVSPSDSESVEDKIRCDVMNQQRRPDTQDYS